MIAGFEMTHSRNIYSPTNGWVNGQNGGLGLLSGFWSF